MPCCKVPNLVPVMFEDGELSFECLGWECVNCGHFESSYPVCPTEQVVLKA